MVGRSEIVLYHLFVSFPGRVFEVFEFLWFFPALFLLTGVVSPGRSRWMAACLLATLATAAAPGLLVWDASRSVLYLLPGVAAAALFVPVSLERRRELLLAAALASLVWIEFYGSIFRRLIL
jgi:hypothetical protein